MQFIKDELDDVSKRCENVIEGSRLVSCFPTMVRIEISITNFKYIVICIQFPEEYPKTPLLLELKSKTLSDKLLQRLTEVCEKKLKEWSNKPQIIRTAEFVRTYIVENPLCCCFDELTAIRTALGNKGTIKLKQKISAVALDVMGNKYHFKSKIVIPDNYPDKPISIEDIESNFPDVFIRYLVGQARELARKCVEPPLRPAKGPQVVFKPSPSLQGPTIFIIQSVQRFPNELCPVCGIQCLPDNPDDVILDELHEKHVERVLCGHLYHQGCLTTYVRTPPFPPGGKQCPKCSKKVQHDKWGLCPRLAEQRWAHQQARDRELQEVKDFLQ